METKGGWRPRRRTKIHGPRCPKPYTMSRCALCPARCLLHTPRPSKLHTMGISIRNQMSICTDRVTAFSALANFCCARMLVTHIRLTFRELRCSWNHVEQAPPDPILGVAEAFKKDPVCPFSDARRCHIARAAYCVLCLLSNC